MVGGHCSVNTLLIVLDFRLFVCLFCPFFLLLQLSFTSAHRWWVRGIIEFLYLASCLLRLGIFNLHIELSILFFSFERTAPPIFIQSIYFFFEFYFCSSVLFAPCLLNLIVIVINLTSQILLHKLIDKICGFSKNYYHHFFEESLRKKKNDICSSEFCGQISLELRCCCVFWGGQ